MTILLLHALATWTLVGLIWFVQMVHYPLFSLVTGETSPRYAAEHQRRTSWVVVPAMLLEATTALLLVAAPPAGVDPRVAWAGATLLGGVWAATFFLQVPLHRRLLRGHDPEVIRRLVLTNGFRTGLWTARGTVAWLLLDGRIAT